MTQFRVSLASAGMLLLVAVGPCQTTIPEQTSSPSNPDLALEQLLRAAEPPVETPPPAWHPKPYLGDPDSALCTNLDYAWRVPLCTGQI